MHYACFAVCLFPFLNYIFFFITKSHLAVYNGQNYLEMSTVPLEIIKCGFWYMCFAKKIFYLQLSFNLSFQILLNAALWNLAKLCVKFPTLTIFLGFTNSDLSFQDCKSMPPAVEIWCSPLTISYCLQCSISKNCDPKWGNKTMFGVCRLLNLYSLKSIQKHILGIPK